MQVTPMDKKDKIFLYAKYYWPAAVTLGLSIFCIFSGNHINKKRILQLTGALALSKKSLTEYKDKVEELVGTKKAQEIEDQVIHDKIVNNPPTEANTVIPNMGNVPDLSLWYDVDSDRYFYSNIEYIRKAEIEAQRMLEANGTITRNDIYGILGIKEIPLGENSTWIYDPDRSGVHNEIRLKTGADLDDKGNPVGTLTMNDLSLPSNEWFSEV
jgi:hypothetical protein